MGLYLAKVDISSNRPAEILDMFKDCPYFAHGFHHLRPEQPPPVLRQREHLHPGGHRERPYSLQPQWVTAVDFNIVIASERPFVLPTRLVMQKVDGSPCGHPIGCRNCKAFKDMKCMGCPATGQYQGHFFVTVE